MINKIHCLIGACALALSVSSNASVGVARPFGAEMGAAGSCLALEKNLREIDNRIIDIQPPGFPPKPPGISYYSPLDKVFPGAIAHLMVFCVESRIKVLAFTVDKGPGNWLLLQTINDLREKYELSSLSDPIDQNTFMEKGGKMIFNAKNSVVITVRSFKNNFNLNYEYFGPTNERAIEFEREQSNQRLLRKRAL